MQGGRPGEIVSGSVDKCEPSLAGPSAWAVAKVSSITEVHFDAVDGDHRKVRKGEPERRRGLGSVGRKLTRDARDGAVSDSEMTTARDGLQQPPLTTDTSTNMDGIVPAPPPYPPNMPPLDYTGNSFAILFTSLALAVDLCPASGAEAEYCRTSGQPCLCLHLSAGRHRCSARSSDGTTVPACSSPSPPPRQSPF